MKGFLTYIQHSIRECESVFTVKQVVIESSVSYIFKICGKVYCPKRNAVEEGGFSDKLNCIPQIDIR